MICEDAQKYLVEANTLRFALEKRVSELENFVKKYDFYNRQTADIIKNMHIHHKYWNERFASLPWYKRIFLICHPDYLPYKPEFKI